MRGGACMTAPPGAAGEGDVRFVSGSEDGTCKVRWWRHHCHDSHEMMTSSLCKVWSLEDKNCLATVGAHDGYVAAAQVRANAITP